MGFTIIICGVGGITPYIFNNKKNSLCSFECIYSKFDIIFIINISLYIRVFIYVMYNVYLRIQRLKINIATPLQS